MNIDRSIPTTTSAADGPTPSAALELRSVRVTPPSAPRGRRSARASATRPTSLGHEALRQAVLDGVDLTVARGETVALLGRSGAGKSVTVRTILGLNPTGWTVEGEVVVAGQRVDPSRPSEARQVRLHRAAAVLQDPRGVFNPLRRIGDFATEAAIERGTSRSAALAQAVTLLEEVGLPAPEGLLQRYPHELSGGMLQRVAIATALSGEPGLLIADEPTAALDVLSQAEVVASLTRAQRNHGFGLLFVTHDLALAAAIADRIVVLDGGRIVDAVPAGALAEATHPTTRALVDASATTAGATPARPATAARSAASPTTPSTSSVRWPLALQVDGLTRRFGATVALDDVSLSIERGRTLALVGGSGSGKSTLARIVAGLSRPDAGTVRVGATAERLPSGHARRLRATPPSVQMVFQDPALSLDPRLTAQAAVSRALGTAGVSRRERGSRARQLLDLVGIDAETSARRTTGLSGGQCQRVSIARALALQPELLVLDEATSALDPETRRQIVDLLSEVQATLGLALLVVTHDLGLVTSLADEIVVLHHGRVVEAGPAADVIAAPQAAYTQLLLAALPHRGWRPQELARRRRTLDGGGVDVVDGGRPQRSAGQLQRA